MIYNLPRGQVWETLCRAKEARLRGLHGGRFRLYAASRGGTPVKMEGDKQLPGLGGTEWWVCPRWMLLVVTQVCAYTQSPRIVYTFHGWVVWYMDFISIKQFYRTIEQEFPDLGSPRTDTIHQIPWCWQAWYMILLSVSASGNLTSGKSPEKLRYRYSKQVAKESQRGFV